MVRVRKRIPGRIFALVSSLLVVSPMFVSAAEWYFQPTLSAGYEFDDNRFLRFEGEDEESASTWKFSPSATFGRRTENFNLSGTARVDVNESNKEELDRTDVFTRFSPTYNTERHKWGLNTIYTRDTLFRSNFVSGISEDPDLFGIELDQFDRVDVTRNVVSVAPSWDWLVSPRIRLGLGYRYIDTFYSDSGVTDISDSRRHIGTAGFAYRFSEANEVTLNSSFQRFENDNQLEFDTYSVGLGLNHRFSDTLKGDVSVGVQHTDGESLGESGSDTSVSFDAGLEKRFETSELIFRFQRSVAPSAFGNALERNRFDIRWSGDLSPRWSYNVAGRFLRNERLGESDPANNDDRYYAQFEPTLSYRLIRSLFLDGSYRFRWADADDEDENAISNAFFVSVNYRWDKISISR